MFKQHKMYMGLKSFMVRSAKAIDRPFVILPLTEEEPWHSQGIHKTAVKNFIVYFFSTPIKLCSFSAGGGNRNQAFPC